MIAQQELIVTEVPPSRWDGLVCCFPDYTIYHTWPWLQTLKTMHTVEPLLLQVSRSGMAYGDSSAHEHPLAIWPCLIMRKGPLRVVGSPLPGWSTAYMGPLFAPHANVDEALAAFFQHKRLARQAYFACKIVNRSRPVDLSHFGFNKVMELDTYSMDLTQSLDTLWSNLKSECRSRIRKAQQLGVEIRAEPDLSFLDEFWQMSIETFQKSRMQPTYSREFVVEMWNRLGPPSQRGAIMALSAFQGDQRLATLVLPMDSHTMYYWGGASFQQFRDVPAHNLLHWHAMTTAKGMGLREYDFICTFGGPGRFKKTFGPQIIPMATHWERSQSRMMAALKRHYQGYLLRRRRVEV